MANQGLQHDQLFEQGSDYGKDDKKFRSHYLIRCSKCPGTDTIRFNRFNRSLPPQFVAKKFSQKGWVIGTTRANDVCPTCLQAVVTDRQRRKETKVIERKRAEVDMVIAEAKLPPAVPLEPPIADLSRKQLVLLDRLSEQMRLGAYLSSTLEVLIDRVAEVQAAQARIQAEIAELPHTAPTIPVFKIEALHIEPPEPIILPSPTTEARRQRREQFRFTSPIRRKRTANGTAVNFG